MVLVVFYALTFSRKTTRFVISTTWFRRYHVHCAFDSNITFAIRYALAWLVPLPIIALAIAHNATGDAKFMKHDASGPMGSYSIHNQPSVLSGCHRIRDFVEHARSPNENGSGIGSYPTTDNALGCRWVLRRRREWIMQMAMHAAQCIIWRHLCGWAAYCGQAFLGRGWRVRRPNQICIIRAFPGCDTPSATHKR
jgi:hypothetical protein